MSPSQQLADIKIKVDTTVDDHQHDAADVGLLDPAQATVPPQRSCTHGRITELPSHATTINTKSIRSCAS